MSNGYSGVQAKAVTVFVALVSFLFSAEAMAESGQPRNWQLGFQEAVTPIMRQLNDFHNFLLVLITVITLFVLGLLVYVALRFNENANPTPSKTSHHTILEVLWTVVPILILVVIAVPSFRLLFAQYDFPKADLTVKAIGNQWYWSYEYPDQDNLAFDAIMLEDDELKPGQPRLLATDNEVVVPVNKNVHILVTASDVLHNWTIPAFGVKVDAVPGRLIRTWFRAEKTGVYYGQCSELCGQKHAYMPITVRVVSDAEFASWLETAKKKFASLPTEVPSVGKNDISGTPTRFALNQRQKE
jgi:cytochrome c oxidase subunit 2